MANNNFSTYSVQEIVYNTIGPQHVIDISPSNSGVLQIECSHDAQYSVLGSVLRDFMPKPIPEAQNVIGPVCFGPFVAIQLLQINIISLGNGGVVRVQLIIS